MTDVIPPSKSSRAHAGAMRAVVVAIMLISAVVGGLLLGLRIGYLKRMGNGLVYFTGLELMRTQGKIHRVDENIAELSRIYAGWFFGASQMERWIAGVENMSRAVDDSLTTCVIYSNLTERVLNVSVRGISPDVSPLAPLGTSSVLGVKNGVAIMNWRRVARPLQCGEEISIHYTADDMRQESEARLRRDEQGIPEFMDGGRLVFYYGSNGVWSVRYLQ